MDNNTLYIADSSNNRVVVIQFGSTNATTIIGSRGNASNQLMGPSDVFVTSTFIYIVEESNYRVQRWPRNGSNITTVAGITGVFGNPSSTNAFRESYGMQLDKYGYLFVADRPNNRVLRFPPESVSGVSGVIVAGTGTMGSTPSQLMAPTKAFVDDDRTMYIADTANNRVQKWTYGACAGLTVAGNGTLGSSMSQLFYPMSVIVDSNQYIYVADAYNHRIQRWAPGASVGECIVGCSGTTGNRSNQLYAPQYLAFDNQGALYVADTGNHRVQKFVLSSAIGKWSYLHRPEIHVRNTCNPMDSAFPFPCLSHR